MASNWHKCYSSVASCDLYNQHNIAEQTFYYWRKKYGGMTVPEAQRLVEFQDLSSRQCRLTQRSFRLAILTADSCTKDRMTPQTNHKEVLPDMPQEVFDIWIAPHIENKGWPFTSTKMHTKGTVWFEFFVCRSLRYWASLQWVRVNAPSDKFRIAESSLVRARAIIDHVKFSRKTITSNIQDSSTRFMNCADFLSNQNTFPVPVIVHNTGSGFEFVDGHHRLAALLDRGNLNNFVFNAWLGHCCDL